LSLKKHRSKKTTELAADYKRQNSALLHTKAHDITVTPFNATMNTAWQLLHNYKSNEEEGKPQLASQMRTNKSVEPDSQTTSKETLHLGNKDTTNTDMPSVMTC